MLLFLLGGGGLATSVVVSVARPAAVATSVVASVIITVASSRRPGASSRRRASSVAGIARFRLRVSKLAAQITAANSKLVTLVLVYDGLLVGLLKEANKGKSARSSRVIIQRNVDLSQLSKLAEKVLELVAARVRREALHHNGEEFRWVELAVTRARAFAAWRRSFARAVTRAGSTARHCTNDLSVSVSST